MRRPYLSSHLIDQARADFSARKQFSHDIRQGAGRDDNLGDARFEGFASGLQLGSHAAGSDAIFDQVPAFIQA